MATASLSSSAGTTNVIPTPLSSLSKDVQIAFERFLSQLRRRQRYGSFPCARETLLLLRHIVSHSKWGSAAALIDLLRTVGTKLSSAQPAEMAVGNVVRRVLHVVREEAQDVERPGNSSSAVSPYWTDALPALSAGNAATVTVESSMYNLLADPHVALERTVSHSSGLSNSVTQMDKLVPLKPTPKQDHHNFKPLLIQGINDMMDELDSLGEHIASQALEHIHSNEIIMTMGQSQTVANFLQHAARKRQFQVIVAETAPEYGGHIMAATLSKAGIETTLISDSAVFAMMGRVNKVILGTHAVTANGGLIAVSGSAAMTSAARHHATPVVVLCGLYKLTPLFPNESDPVNVFNAPAAVLSWATLDDADAETERQQLTYPYFDYVPPADVSLFITNVGGHPPTYIYRLLGELYNVLDYQLN